MIFLTNLGSFSVVRLRLAIPAGVGPVAGVALGGGPNLGARAGPEPAVDIRGLKVGAVAACEVALATRCPNEPHVTARDPLLDKFIFLQT